MDNSESQQLSDDTVQEEEERDGAIASNQLHNPQVKEEELDKVPDVELAYKDQGFHEMEFTLGEEIELDLRKQQCKKNPGHLGFIPAKNFTIEHLPECSRNTLVFDLITTLISLTVRLSVKFTSSDRPPKYPLYNRRGQTGVTAFGSGLVRFELRKFSKKDNSTCPCEKCKQSPERAKKQWGEFWVDTAMHVVYDTSEARCTKCNLFFDSEEDRYKCPSLDGVEIADTDMEKDVCNMVCITHDEDLCSKLETMIGRFDHLRRQLMQKYSVSGHVAEEKTAVVISHPHGLSKFVTVGEWTGREGDVMSQWKYTAETCGGSSGAPVFILGEWDKECWVNGPYYTAHSGCKQKGRNESIAGTFLHF